MRQFYGHLEKCVLSAGKTMSVKFPFFLGGGLGGRGECRFYFYGRADFSERKTNQGALNPVFLTPFLKLNFMHWVCGVLLRCFGKSDCHQLGECLHDDCDPPNHHI